MGTRTRHRTHAPLFALLLAACTHILAAHAAPPRNAETHAYWVFLNRRDTREAAWTKARSELDPKAVARRERARGAAITTADLPPRGDDLDAIRRAGGHLRTASRWLNAVSVDATPEAARRIAGLAHVRNVRPVAVSRGVEPAPSSPSPRGVADIDSSIYGVAWIQNELVHAPEVHELGYRGDGVRIGFLDAGFVGITTHDVFRGLDIVDTWNVIDSTSNVSTHAHGTRCVSVALANERYHMVGISPHAEVLLVRTEDASDEYPAEEDYWVAGLEWAEAHGADLISSSLSYRNWYTREDMNGHTAVTTIAADQAAARGLLVVNSAGNSGEAGLGAPADGDSVLAVGATDSEGLYVSFSSQGPTADGRIKPDVSAMGLNARVVNTSTEDGFEEGSGTSYSCPAVAGVVALMLQVNPTLEPEEIIQMLRGTASQAETPDNFLGWGVVDALAAVQEVIAGVDERTVTPLPADIVLRGVFPNPTNAAARIDVDLPHSGLVHLRLYDLLGRRILAVDRRAGAGPSALQLSLSGLASGIYPFTVRLGEGRKTSGRVVLVK